MFSYYGSKSKIVDYYPYPKYDKIIEPFAGSARYSLKHFDKDVLLVDKYEVVVDVWKYLQQASEQDILKLPTLKRGETVNDFNLSDIEKTFIGFYAKTGNSTPCIRASDRTLIHRPKLQDYQKKNIANQLFKIKHWVIRLDDYKNIKNETATWFIDPPYEYGGQAYKISNKHLDYNELAEWCRGRSGQVMVCENSKADWLPFRQMAELKGSRYKTTEVIWSNQQTEYDYENMDLF
ncbi:MAG: hypothetical protein KKH44_07750 [Bacteroidetes bacterium]|nr:hypothetical protein [Bacteroidota bacterium]